VDQLQDETPAGCARPLEAEPADLAAAEAGRSRLPRFSKDRVLVIIDMEEGAARSRYHDLYLNRRWWARHEEVCGKILAIASRFERVIMVVDTTFRNPRHQEIVPPLQPLLERAELVNKGQDDGSAEVAALLSGNDRLYVCGMNTDACVLRTARGLSRKGFDITVLSDASWTVYSARLDRFGKSHRDALSRMRRFYGIKVADSASVLTETADTEAATE